MGIFGPSGGTRGTANSAQVSNIAFILVYAGEYVNAIELYPAPDYSTPTVYGNVGTGPLAGRIDFQPGEILVGIQGRCGDYVDSIRFITNGRTIPDPGLPAFGGTGGGQAYEYYLDEGFIVGFFGNTGDWIDSIGIYTQLS